MEINYFEASQNFSENIEEIKEQNNGQETNISEPDFDTYGFYPDASF